jgi:hypothetical protein
MLVVSGQRKIVFQHDRGNPNIILWNGSPKAPLFCVDSPIVVSGSFVYSQDGAELNKLLDLPEALS